MKSLLLCALLIQTAAANTIIQSSGNSQASVPLGYYAPYAADGLTPIVFAAGWTQGSAYNNVDVFANLFTTGSPGTVNYELVTAIGPGTTFAADGIVEGSVATPTNPSDVSLFQLSSLGPGTYYLVLSSSVDNTAWQYNYPLQTNDTLAPDVTFLGDQWSYGTSIDTAYVPASSFSGVNIPVEFSVQGTAATPEPATYSLIDSRCWPYRWRGGSGARDASASVGRTIVFRRLPNGEAAVFAAHLLASAP